MRYRKYRIYIVLTWIIIHIMFFSVDSPYEGKLTMLLWSLCNVYVGIQIGKPTDDFYDIRRKILRLKRKAARATNINVYHKNIEKLDREIMLKRNQGIFDETEKTYLMDCLYQIVMIPVTYE